MKKIISRFAAICLAACLSLTIAGCGSNSNEAGTETANITIDEIIKANSSDALLSKYDNILNHIDGEHIFLSDLYISKDYGYENNVNGQLLVTTEGIWDYMDVNGENYLVYRWYAMDESEKAEMAITPSNFTEPVLDSIYTPKEEIQDIKDNGDGTLTITTKLDSEYAAEELSLDSIEYPDEYYTSDMKCVYLLDKESLEVKSLTQSFINGDEEIPYSVSTITYNADYPENMKDMMSQADEFMNGEKTSPKTVTLVYDYGTDEEESFSLTYDQKFKASIYTRYGYDNLYNDPEKTELYAGSEGINDVTIYTFKE